MSDLRSRRPKSSGVVVPHQAQWYQRLGAAAYFGLEHLLIATLRFTWEDNTDLFKGDKPQPVIFCVWHNRLALSMAIFRKYPRRCQPTRRLAALVSASKDGALLAAVLETFDVHAVRGSSSRRGPQALRELTTCAERGYDLAITPDGPRGPRYVVQEGVIALAQLTGLPIVPVTVRLGRKYAVNSWDGFQIPMPFARCEVRFSTPIWVPRDAGDAEREKLRLDVQSLLAAD